MSDFSDFNELYEPLVLPINGKKYTIPPLSFTAGGIVNGVIKNKSNAKKPDGDVPDAEEGDDVEFFRLILSPEIFEEMVADNVPDVAIDRAGQAALADFKYGRAMAEVMWKTGGDPKAIQPLVADQTPPAPNRAARRSKGTAAANKTP